MDYLRIVFRVLHVLGAVFWVGTALLMNLFINPSLKASAEAGHKVMAHLLSKTRFATTMMVVSVTVMISGFGLFWIDMVRYSSAWVQTGTGLAYGAGGLVAVVGWLAGLRIGNTGKAIGKLSAQMKDTPSPKQIIEMKALVKRQEGASKLNFVCLVITILLMVFARFL